MQRTFLFIVALLAVGFSGLYEAQGQVDVGVSLERKSYLLYEAVYVKMLVINNSPQEVLLGEGATMESWLSFIIIDSRGKSVKADRNAVYPRILLKSGEKKSFVVNITPYYAFRDVGDYKIQGVITLADGTQIVSAATHFQVMEGRVMWSQSRPYGNQTLVYSLIRFSPDFSSTYLYLRVEDPGQNAVYNNTSLGDIADVITPQVYFDSKNSLHVFHIVGTALYRYTRLDALGNTLHQSTYKSTQEFPPMLRRMDDGTVLVAGGEQDHQGERARLSDVQGVGPARTGEGSSGAAALSATGDPSAPSSQNKLSQGQSQAPYIPTASAVPYTSSTTPASPDPGLPSRTGKGSRSK